jgi:hypothetical protein
MKAMLGISVYSCPYLNWQKHYVFLIIAYFYSSTELKKSTVQVLPGSEGGGREEGGGGGQGEEMTQTRVRTCE